MSDPWLRSAITDDHDQVDAGRMGVVVLIGLILGVIPFMCLMVIAKVVAKVAWNVDVPLDLLGLGGGVGAVCGGFGTALAALGLYLWGDKKPTPALPPKA